MYEFDLSCPKAFNFIDVVYSHGWYQLPPFEWETDSESLTRSDDYGEQVIDWEMRATGDGKGVQLRTNAEFKFHEPLRRLGRQMLALDDEFDAFHQMCDLDPGLHAAKSRGKGRILRCPTVWEEVVKTLFSVNTTWNQTRSMTRNLVGKYGRRSPDGRASFPTPAIIAQIPEYELQQQCRIGYRAAPLALLARQICDGVMDLEALRSNRWDPDQAEAYLRSIRGIGPYAAANVMMLLGHYDHLPIDSWFRKTMRETWFYGQEATETEMAASFDRFRPFRTLVYLFYDWDSARSENR